MVSTINTRSGVAAGVVATVLLLSATPANAGICTACGSGSGGGTPVIPGPPIIGPAQSGVTGGPVTATATWSPPEDTKYIEYGVKSYRVRATMVQPIYDTTTNTTQYIVLASPSYYVVASTYMSTSVTLPQAGNYIFDVQAITFGGDTTYSAASNLVKGQ